MSDSLEHARTGAVYFIGHQVVNLIHYHCMRDEETVRIISARNVGRKKLNIMRNFVMRDDYDITRSIKNSFP